MTASAAIASITLSLPGLALAKSDEDVCQVASPAIAIPACTRLIERDAGGDGLFNAYLNRGNSHFLIRDHKSAIADYREAIARWPQYTVTYVNRAAVYLDLGQLDRAIADYDYAIKGTPNFAGAYRGRGRAFEARGDVDRAVADYKKAVELDRSDPHAAADLKRLAP